MHRLYDIRSLCEPGPTLYTRPIIGEGAGKSTDRLEGGVGEVHAYMGVGGHDASMVYTSMGSIGIASLCSKIN